MKKTYLGFGIVIAVLVILGVMWISSYNHFVSLNENVNQSYSQIENQLQRRMDLIPNLVNTVKGYASHEKAVIASISDARAKLAGAKSPQEAANANADLSNALNRLLVVVENYPNLKADRQFTQLMDELAGTENRIAVARKDYNDQVAIYNKDVKSFPGSIVARISGFEQKEYFKADSKAKEAPKVDFGSNGQ